MRNIHFVEHNNLQLIYNVCKQGKRDFENTASACKGKSATDISILSIFNSPSALKNACSGN